MPNAANYDFYSCQGESIGFLDSNSTLSISYDLGSLDAAAEDKQFLGIDFLWFLRRVALKMHKDPQTLAE